MMAKKERTNKKKEIAAIQLADGGVLHQ